MQSALYVGLSAQVALEKRLQTIANNVANVNTAAFRTDVVKFETVLSKAGANPVAFSSPGDAQQAGISTVYQEVNLCTNLSVGENVMLGHEPRAAGHAVTGIARTQPGLGATMGISLGTLAGLPPSPLFLSEILVIAGGFQAGRSWAAAGTAVMLALGFVGLAHALVETTGGRARRRDREVAPGLRPVMALGAASTVILLALAAAAFWLPDTDIVEALARGIG